MYWDFDNTDPEAANPSGQMFYAGNGFSCLWTTEGGGILLFWDAAENHWFLRYDQTDLDEVVSTLQKEDFICCGSNVFGTVTIYPNNEEA